jgi:hypothetical protein
LVFTELHGRESSDELRRNRQRVAIAASCPDNGGCGRPRRPDQS